MVMLADKIRQISIGAINPRDLEINNIPTLMVFLLVFGVAAAVTESQPCALRRALKANKNPASYGEIIYFQVAKRDSNQEKPGACEQRPTPSEGGSYAYLAKRSSPKT